MAIISNFYCTDSKSGADFNNPFTSVDSATAPNPSVPAAPFALGERAQGNAGSEWVFVRASATVSAFNLVAINKDYRAINLTTALPASNIYTFGIAQFQPRGGVTSGNANGGVVNTDDYFWALVKCAQGARVNATVSATMTVATQLYISGSHPGYVVGSASMPTSASPGGGRLNGMFMAGAVVEALSGTTPTAIEIGMFSYIMPGVIVSAYPISTTA